VGRIGSGVRVTGLVPVFVSFTGTHSRFTKYGVKRGAVCARNLDAEGGEIVTLKLSIGREWGGGMPHPSRLRGSEGAS